MFNLSANGSLPISISKYTNKYSLPPLQKCKQAACASEEECLLLTLTALNLDVAIISVEKITQALSLDAQDLVTEQNKIPSGWFYRTAENQENYNLASKYIENNQATRHLFDTHKKYLQARQTINFYKNMPLSPSSISDWIKTDLYAGELFPLQKYKSIVQKDLALIHELTLSEYATNYPTLTHELFQLKENLQHSLKSIERMSKIELKEKEESDYRQAKTEELRINTENNRRLTQAEIEKKTRLAIAKETETQAMIGLFETQLKMQRAQEEENRILSTLNSMLSHINWNCLNSLQTTDKLRSLKQEITDLKTHIADNNSQKAIVHRQLSILIEHLDQKIQVEELPQAILHLKNIRSGINRDTQTAQDVANSLQKLLDNLNYKQKNAQSEINQIRLQLQKLKEDNARLEKKVKELEKQSRSTTPIYVEAYPVADDDDTLSNLHSNQLATAIPVSESGRCEK